MVVSVFLAAFWLRASLRALAAPLVLLQSQLKDALLSISMRADKAEKLAEAALAQLGTFERAVSDKRALESSLASEKANAEYLRERLTETQRAILALANPQAEARVVGQTNRDKAPEEIPVAPRPGRWAGVGNGSYDNVEPLVHTLTKNNPSTTFRASDYSGLARREAGLAFTQNDEGL